MTVLLLLAMAAAESPRVVYSKTFPGAQPEFVSVALDKTGKAEFRDNPADENPLRFQLTEAETAEIFALVEKLERFKRPLESGLKVARMGDKIFRYEHGEEKNEVKFNYSQDLDARALQDWFERITETELHLINLERTVRFDRLGINAALIQLQNAYERKRLVAPEQFLKLLDRIIKNDNFMHMSRDRASALADAFRAPVKAE
jgi:hypothetical protein